MDNLNALPLARPRLTPELDPAFRPAALVNDAFRQWVSESPGSQKVDLALERVDGSVSRFSTEVLPEDHPNAQANFPYLERLTKFLLWSRGASRIYLAGPELLGDQLKRHFEQSTTGRFDADVMGNRIYERPFQVIPTSFQDLPPAHETSAPLGRHLDGCRIGFDLGASDRKVAAVQDGEPVFTEEVPWDPKAQSDPNWHFDQIMSALRRAADHLPRVDAIGGSAAGVYVNNQVKVASLFRGVPQELWPTKVKDLFLEIRKAWGNIPLEVVNDGEVTALAGSMALGENGVLGIAMGSSEAAGYVKPDGTITSWLNELAFAPVDFNPNAAVDEWSGDGGCGVQYFSQQCVDRLLEPAGIQLDPDMPVPDKLVAIQELVNNGDERAAAVFQTIGTYLGYTLAHYAEFYDFKYLLILGRVTSGKGGELILDRTNEVLRQELPELHGRIRFHQPEETEKRHGQAVAAASLPQLQR